MAKAKGKAARMIVRGEVQGVGFRYAIVGRARGLGVMGWVRNGAVGEVLVTPRAPRRRSPS